MKTKKVAIVGGGIIGLSTAYYLNKAGLEVEVIDQTDGSNNCSFGNAGYVSPSHLIPLASPGIISQGLRWMTNSKSPFYIQPRFDFDLFKWGLLFKKASTNKRVKAAIPVLYELTTKSQQLYEGLLASEDVEAGYHKPGLMMICQTQRALNHELELVEAATKLGLSAYQLSRAETEELEPQIKYQMAGSLYFECDGWMSPHIFMRHFQQLLIKKGVNFSFNTKVLDLELNANKVSKLVTQNGVVEASEFVLTAGAWTPQLLKKLRFNLPLQAGKGYSFMMHPDHMPKLPSILVEGRIATSPMLDGLRIAGTMELTGINHKIDQNRIEGIINSVKEAMPQYASYDFGTIKPWAGLRPCTPDGLPYIGRVPGHENLQIGTGHAMLGWTLGPITGQMLADGIIGNEPAVKSPLLSVARYS